MTPVIMLAVQQTIQMMMPPNKHRKIFAHPKLRGGRYWRPIKYTQKRRERQPLYNGAFSKTTMEQSVLASLAKHS